MNGLMVAMGLWLAGLGGYTYRNAKSETERGLRWRGFDTSKVRVDDHPRAVRRNAGVGLFSLVLGGVLLVSGVLELSQVLLGGMVLVLTVVGGLAFLFLT